MIIDRYDPMALFALVPNGFTSGWSSLSAPGRSRGAASCAPMARSWRPRCTIPPIVACWRDNGVACGERTRPPRGRRSTATPIIYSYLFTLTGILFESARIGAPKLFPSESVSLCTTGRGTFSGDETGRAWPLGYLSYDRPLLDLGYFRPGPRCPAHNETSGGYTEWISTRLLWKIVAKR